MSKNMTRKGLAFGAGLSLVVSSFAALPAQATGITGFIPLVPATGPSDAFAVEAVDSQTFSLQASPASTVMGNGNLKFLVKDELAKLVPGASTTGAASDTLAVTDNLDIDAVTDTVMFTTAGVANGQYYMHVTDNLVATNGTASQDLTILVKDTLVQVSVNDNVGIFKSPADIVRTDYNAFSAQVTAIFVKGGTSTQSEDGLADSTTDFNSVSTANDTINVDVTIPDGTYFAYSQTNLVADDGNSNPVTIWTANKVSEVTVTSNTVTLKSENDVDSAGAGHVLDGIDGTPMLIFVSKSALSSAVRAADNSYVVDSGQNGVGNQPVLQLVATETGVTRKANVTAFIDLFADRKIGASEYVSSAVDVTFVAQADLVTSTTLVSPQVGQTTLSAEITTTPAINGAQNANKDMIRAAFTRQGSQTVAISAGATQDEDTLVWKASVDLNTEANKIYVWTSATAAISASATPDGRWANFVEPVAKSGAGANTTASTNNLVSISLASTGVVTVTTFDDHGLMSGDKITMTISASEYVSGLSVAGETGRTVTVTGPKSFTYTVTETGTITAAASLAIAAAAVGGINTGLHTGTGYVVSTYTAGGGDGMVDRVFAGDYSAQAALETGAATRIYVPVGTASKKGTLAASAADVVFTSTASASVQGIEDRGDSVTATGDLLVKEGTKSLDIVATVVDKDGVALGAGRTVTVSLTNRSTNVTVNGLKVTQNLTTDANGQIKLTVASTTALKTEAVDITAVAENVSTATSSIRVLWAEAAIQIADLNTTDAKLPATQKRTIAEGASYDVALFVTDQWYTPADAATYRIKVSGEGVTGQFLDLVAGKATFKVTDTKVKTDYNSVITLQKKSTTGVWADTTTVVTLNNLTEATPGILFDADGSSLYGSVAADLSDAVAAKALVERDLRTANVAQPVYANAVTINGKVVDTGTNVGQAGAVVTISGPSNILFSYGSVDKRGSLTFVAEDSANAGEVSGEFTVNLYSTTAQTDTVITITSAGVSKTVKVTFTGIGVGEGTALTVTAPDAVKPASTFQVKAKLADVYGNGVEATAGRVKVTYTGAGIVFGTLPDKTDKNGELMFSVLLGSNDTGNVVVTVSYDQNGDGDYVDAKDLNTTKTIAITASGTLTTGKVNVGSFNGKLVVYASGLNGARISWKVGGVWGVGTATSNYAIFNRPTPRAGVTVSVDIYVNGVKTLTKSVLTR